MEVESKMPTCSFSGQKIPPGTGMMYVLKDGKVLWFKDSKSMKNHLKLKRKPVKTRWTEYYRKEHNKGVKAEPAVKTTAEKETKVAKKGKSAVEPAVEPANAAPPAGEEQ